MSRNKIKWGRKPEVFNIGMKGDIWISSTKIWIYMYRHICTFYEDILLCLCNKKRNGQWLGRRHKCDFLDNKRKEGRFEWGTQDPRRHGKKTEDAKWKRDNVMW